MKKILQTAFIVMSFQLSCMEKGEISDPIAVKSKINHLYNQQKTDVLACLAIYDLQERCNDPMHAITNKKVLSFLQQEELLDENENVHPLIEQCVRDYVAKEENEFPKKQQDDNNDDPRTLLIG